MVNKMYELKNQIIERIDKDIHERGIDRIDVEQIGKLVDMVKDLAEAEESCMEAKYYDLVAKAMEGNEKSGYGMGYASRDNRPSGYTSRDNNMVSGYHSAIDQLAESMKSANFDERNKIRDEVLSLLSIK